MKKIAFTALAIFVAIFAAKIESHKSLYFNINYPIYGDTAAYTTAFEANRVVSQDEFFVLNAVNSKLIYVISLFLPTTDIIKSYAPTPTMLRFEIRSIRFWDSPYLRVRNALKSELDKVALKTGDLGIATAWRNKTGEISLRYFDYDGKRLQFVEIREPDALRQIGRHSESDWFQNKSMKGTWVDTEGKPKR